jgi:tryptophanase
MISREELRHIVEMAFLPKKCVCTVDAGGLMTIQIFNQNTHQQELTFSGIDSSGLTTGRPIAALVLGLREELRRWHLDPERRLQSREPLANTPYR